MRILGTRVWIRCVSFFVRNALSLLVIAPLLIVPFVTDALVTILIDQEQREGRPRPVAAVQQELRGLPAYERLKLYYWLRAFAWALIPIASSKLRRLCGSLALPAWVVSGRWFRDSSG